MSDEYDLALEAAVLENPSDENFAVYGDWFEQRGHPRGHLIALHLGGRYDDARAWIEQHPILGDVNNSWIRGFWRSTHVLHREPHQVAHPSARLIEVLHLIGSQSYRQEAGGTVSRRATHPADASVVEALAALVGVNVDTTVIATVERLRLGDPSFDIDSVELTHRDEGNIRALRGLCSVFLRGNIAPEAWRAFGAHAETLRGFHIYYARPGEDVGAMLATFTKLESLTLDVDRMGDGVEQLCKIASLKKASFLGELAPRARQIVQRARPDVVVS